MQKKILLSLLFVTLYGCGERMDMAADSSFPADGIIRVSVGTSGVSTRAGIDNSGDLAKFRLFVNNPANLQYSYNNIEMRREGGQFTAYKDESPLTLFWQNSLAEVSLVSSTLPAGDLSQSINVSVTSDQSNPDSIKSSDFLYFKSERFIPETDLVNGKIPIAFTHMCAKLICTVTLGESYSTIDEASVSGAALSRLFNLGESRWQEGPDSDPGTIAPYKVSELPLADGLRKEIIYECILVPQTVSRLELEFVINNRHFNFHTPQGVVLEGNSTYEFRININ